MLPVKEKLVLGLILIPLLIGGLYFFRGNGNEVKAGTDEVYENIEVFSEVLREIQRSYVEPQEPKDLIYGAIKGMVESLDPHSSFLTSEEYRDLMQETKGSFSGIGIEITLKENLLTVVSPIEGTPAYKAGIKAGDVIVKIEDQFTKNMSLMEAVKQIRGPKGSKIKLMILREKEEKPLEFTITRDVIPLRSVKHYFMTPTIGYVRISNFQSKTADDAKKALDILGKNNELRGLIVDLRNNPGGLLAQAIEVSDLFLDSGTIVSTKGRNSSQNVMATAHKNEKQINYPIIVLVNGGSASAAEIVAGALQDNKVALILGTRTFGKGSVQTILPLSNGAGLRLTTARYYTPSGKSIQISGITPDVELAFVPSDDEEEEKEMPRFLREGDLTRHMENKAVKDSKTTKKRQKPEKDQLAKELFEKDNQVRRAVELIQSWEVFSKIKNGM